MARRKAIGRERSGYPGTDDGDVDRRAICWPLASPAEEHADADPDGARSGPCQADIDCLQLIDARLTPSAT